MKAILHIGTEKTGTQSIQACLCLNRQKLQEAGFHYVRRAGKQNSRAAVAYCMDSNKDDDFFRNLQLNSLQERDDFRKDFSRWFHNEITSLPAGIHTIILSSEHFHSRLKTLREVERVRELLDPYCSDFNIICYLREQSACCASSFSTTIKSGRIVPFERFFENCTPANHYFNYSTMLSLWEKVFGLHSLSVARFDPDTFLNRSLLDDFVFRISPSLVDVLNTNLPQKNRSLNKTGHLLSQLICRLFSKHSTSQRQSHLRKTCQQIISRNLTGRADLLTPELQDKIHQAFSESNEEVRKKFFPDQNILFPLADREKPVLTKRKTR